MALVTLIKKFKGEWKIICTVVILNYRLSMRHLQLKVPFETKFRNLLSATTFSLHKDSRFHIPFLLLGITGAGSFICWCFPDVTILSAIYMYVYHKWMRWYCKCNSKLLFKVLFKRNLHFLEPKGICQINILLTLVCRSVMKVLEPFFLPPVFSTCISFILYGNEKNCFVVTHGS